MGFVVLAGLFEPGTQVKLYRATNAQARVGGDEPLEGWRLADDLGNVGFDGLEVGQRYFAVGTSDRQMPIEIPVRALADTDGHEIAQPPIRNVPQKIGTQEDPEPVEPVGAPERILHVGVPAGLPHGVTTS